MDRLKILSVISNITAKPHVDTFVLRKGEQLNKLVLPAVLEMSNETDIQFRRASNNLGSIHFRTSG